MPSEMTSTLGPDPQFVWQAQELDEPIRAHDNTADISAGAGSRGPRRLWEGLGLIASIAHEGLQVINGGGRFEDGGVDVTERARAFALFMRGPGATPGFLVFDESHAIWECTPLPADPAALEDLTLSSLQPYEEVITSLVQAIEVVEQNPSVVHFSSAPSAAQSSFWFDSHVKVSSW